MVVVGIVAMTAFDLIGEYCLHRSLIDAEIIAGLLGVAAAILAILFQRRAEFVASVRAEWELCLDAIALVRALYASKAWSEEEYLRTYSKVWAAIDGMRSVYKDHGETGGRVGYYPYATLHDIRLIIAHDYKKGKALEPAEVDWRVDQIESCWRVFRLRFLSELETPETDRPVLKRLLHDTRKYGVSGWAKLVRRLPERVLLDEAALAIPPSVSAPNPAEPLPPPPPSAED